MSTVLSALAACGGSDAADEGQDSITIGGVALALAPAAYDTTPPAGVLCGTMGNVGGTLTAGPAASATLPAGLMVTSISVRSASGQSSGTATLSATDQTTSQASGTGQQLRFGNASCKTALQVGDSVQLSIDLSWNGTRYNVLSKPVQVVAIY